jgi:hypothetical protein
MMRAQVQLAEVWETVMVTLMQQSPKVQVPSWRLTPSKGFEVDVMHLSQVLQALPTYNHMGEKPRITTKVTNSQKEDGQNNCG